MDDNGHGTHCAGIIGAEGGNGLGIAGVNWNVKIMPLRFMDADGTGTTKDAIEAINYVIDRKARRRKRTHHFGELGIDSKSRALEDVIRKAFDEGILFVAAAGNASADNDQTPHYPSSYPVDLVNVCLSRIKKLNPILNSFITVIDEQLIYKQAEISEKEIKQGNYFGPLHGIPFSVKDMFYAKGIRFTAGSRIFTNYISQVDATAVKRMKKAGAILLGSNNLNEFASGIDGKNPFYGDSKNPWDQERISGGSSGGSAVAVATGMAMVSLGTDTGGSIRVPSALCGVVGLKPTYDLISKNNVFPLSPSLDHVGCITKSVWDASYSVTMFK